LRMHAARVALDGDADEGFVAGAECILLLLVRWAESAGEHTLRGASALRARGGLLACGLHAALLELLAAAARARVVSSGPGAAISDGLRPDDARHLELFFGGHQYIMPCRRTQNESHTAGLKRLPSWPKWSPEKRYPPPRRFAYISPAMCGAFGAERICAAQSGWFLPIHSAMLREAVLMPVTKPPAPPATSAAGIHQSKLMVDSSPQPSGGSRIAKDLPVAGSVATGTKTLVPLWAFSGHSGCAP